MSSTASPLTLAYQPYAPRDMRAAPEIRLGSWRFKAYAIEEEPVGFTAGMWDAVRNIVEANLPRLEETQHHHAGFILLHRDTEDVWLLVNWWTHSSIISELLFHADLGRQHDFQEVKARSVACVWEMVPMMFERDAWVRHALSRNGTVTAYLAQSMPEGRY